MFSVNDVCLRCVFRLNAKTERLETFKLFCKVGAVITVVDFNNCRQRESSFLTLATLLLVPGHMGWGWDERE